MSYKREPITFKGVKMKCKLTKSVKDLISSLFTRNREASQRIRFVLMANSGLNPAQKQALREAVEILEKK